MITSVRATDVAAAVAVGDTGRVAAIVREYDARPVNRFRDGSAQLNTLGYRLLREGRGPMRWRCYGSTCGCTPVM